MKKHLERTGYEPTLARLSDTCFSMHSYLPWIVEVRSNNYNNYLRFIVLFLCQGRGMMDRLAIHMQD